MRILIAGLAALTAMAFAAPSFAQQELPAEGPVPTARPKPGTAAYCNTLKSASSKGACLKRVQAHAKAAPAPATPRAKTKGNKPAPAATALKPDSTAAAPPVATPPGSTVAVPPLPQKTI